MLDKVNKPITEDEQLMLQQLIENLAQQSDSQQQMSGVDSSDEQQDNRSETPSSNNDTELNDADLDENDEVHSPVVLEGNVAVEMTRQLQFVGHQLVKLISGLGQTPCMCQNCTCQLKKSLPAVHNKNGQHMNMGAVNQVNKHANNGNSSSGIIEFNEDGSLKRGRKSKYCTSSEKQEVADYADLHGATAAARRFDIPASVAAYYHRKLKKGFTGPGASVPRHAPYPTNAGPKPVNESRQQSLDTNGDETENQQQQRSFNYNTSNTTAESNNYNRTPGVFLRGRGRGRPKLIGDELDAELVEYMVDVKKKLPRAHLTASYALDVARAYIMEKAPQILEENGGHISLKITWAMKLVSRTNERWRELNGEPTPSTPFNANDSSLLQINNQLNEFIAQLNQSGQNGATSEITNIRELQFPFNAENRDEEMDEEEEEEDNTENSLNKSFINSESDPIIAE